MKTIMLFNNIQFFILMHITVIEFQTPRWNIKIFFLVKILLLNKDAPLCSYLVGENEPASSAHFNSLTTLPSASVVSTN